MDKGRANASARRSFAFARDWRVQEGDERWRNGGCWAPAEAGRWSEKVSGSAPGCGLFEAGVTAAIVVGAERRGEEGRARGESPREWLS